MEVQPNANTVSSSIARIIQYGKHCLGGIVCICCPTSERDGSPAAIEEPAAPQLPAVSLDEARELINPMSRPLAEIANTITSNLAKMNQCLDILDKANNDEDRLKACLYRDVEVLRTSKLSSPRTVCTANSCISEVNGVVEFTAICHDRCGLTNVPHDTIGHPQLKNCSCMDSTKHCKVGDCRCSWQVHQHITYSTRREVDKVKDESVQKQIDGNRSVTAIVQSTLNQLTKEIEELEDERNKIGTASAQFTVFLQEHTTDGSFIDMIDQFLETMIEQRRHTNQMDSCKALEKLRQEYQDEKQLLEKALQEEIAEKQRLEKILQEEKELLEKQKAFQEEMAAKVRLDKILQELKELLEKNQAVSSPKSSAPSWTERFGNLWKARPASKPSEGVQPAALPQPFSRKPPPPPASFLASFFAGPSNGLANRNPPRPKPLKLEDVPLLLAELEKLPRSGTSLLQQLQAQK